VTGRLRLDPLSREHDLTTFSSGAPDLDQWLNRLARQAESSGTARTFLLLVDDGRAPVGYYSLAAHSVERELLPDRQQKGAPEPVPMILLARLAVDRAHRGKGYGELLLADAALRGHRAAQTIGARGLLAHARDEAAASFYQRYDFTPSPGRPLMHTVLWKDLAHTLDTE
jgi:GNAT superfamily N-acetyltransferase